MVSKGFELVFKTDESKNKVEAISRGVFKNFAKFKGKTQAFKHKARVTSFPNNPTDFYLFKLNNRNIRKSCEKCSKLTIKSPERLSELVLVSFRS